MKKYKNIYNFLIAFFLLVGIGTNISLYAATEFFLQNMERKTRAVTDMPFVVNEIQSANIDMCIDPSFNFGGWIELYNNGSSLIPLRNLYISDDINHLKKCKLIFESYLMRPKSFRIVWFGPNNETPSNVNFKLNPEGGIIYISNRDGEIILSHIYPPAISRTSYARKVNGGDEWGYTSNPTPGMSNTISNFATERLAAPVVDTDTRLFTQPFDFKVEIPAGTTLKYTTDGVAPGIYGGVVSTDGKFHVDKTAVYRFCLVQEGKLPSPVVTRSFIYDTYHINLPIISVVTNRDYLYNDRIGVFVRGINGKAGNGQSSPCNWNMDWNRPVNIEYLTADGKMVVNQEADLAVSGGWSRANTPHSFKIKAKKKYEGKNYLPYPVFKAKPHLKNKTWQVRNGGNDSKNRMKDAVLQEIVLSSGIDVDGQSCQPVLHFINGEFKGMLNIREPNNKDYAYANFGWDDTEIDMFQISPDSNYCQMCGTDEAFLKWYELSAEAKNSSTYNEICQMIDIDEYINYMAVEMFIGCGDYAKNNIKGFRPRTSDGKFRIVMYDLDSGFGLSNPFGFFESKQTHTFNYDYDKGGKLTAEIKFVTIFLNMLENAKFRKKFIDTYCLVAGSIFEPERSAVIIDSMAQQRVAALKLENKSPLDFADRLKSSIGSRPAAMINCLKRYPRMRMENAKEFNLKLSTNIDKAILYANTTPVPTNKFSGKMFLPMTIKAEAPAEYKFVGWRLKSLSTHTSLLNMGSQWSYYDAGSLDGQPWKQGETAVGWKKGTAPMGYNLKYADIHNKLKTYLDYGDNVSNKRSTYYFHTSFQMTMMPASEQKINLQLLLDDGAVVYINGKEAARIYMPEGNISYGTFANRYASKDPVSHTVEIPVALLKKGKNNIAVEVHNNGAGSSDIYFDAELLIEGQNKKEGEIVSRRNSYAILSPKDYDLTALFEPLSEEEQAALMPPVVINEISADNTIFINEYFRKNDWIELYNRSNKPVDIAGMYLSDDRTNPHKYQIVSRMDKYSTKIEPHSHYIIWADGLRPVSQLHTNFRLAREGGEVLLTAVDDSWADTLVYEAHSGKYSVGRYPDGNENLYLMTMPTFGTANVLNSYARRFAEPEYPLGIETVMPSAEKFGVRYAQRALTVYGATVSPVQIHIYNMCGQCVMQRSVDTEGGVATVALEGLRKGSYVARISDAQGRQCHAKFLITTGW